MNHTAQDRFPELTVTDFGPIAAAEIELRPLTVFVGASNTGKSYLASLIYAMHRVFGGDARLFGSQFRRGLLPLAQVRRDQLASKDVDALLDVARAFDKPRSAESADITLPAPVADVLAAVFDEFADVLAKEVGRCFGVAEAFTLARKAGKSARVVLRPAASGRAEPVEHVLKLLRRPSLASYVPARVPIPSADDPERRSRRDLPHISGILESRQDRAYRRFAVSECLEYVCGMVLPWLFGPLHLPAYYLPADRTGVMHAHSVVISALIANAPTSGFRPVSAAPMLTGVVADFLGQLIQIDRAGRTRFAADHDLDRHIEDFMLRGSIGVDRSPHIDYPRFSYHPREWKLDLPLANASSMVSELAPVVLYLRYLVQRGDVLFLEEPEAHLHPAMQVEFMRRLAALVNAGVRVVLTTHSEWLLDELANIVRRSADCEKPDDDHVALRPEQAGAWEFEIRQRPKGAFVKEMPLGGTGAPRVGGAARILPTAMPSIPSRSMASA